MNPGAIGTTRRPFVLIWEVTRACELACKHCRADAQPRRHPDELTTREGSRLLREAREFGERQLVVLSGGGPLAADPLCSCVPGAYDELLPDYTLDTHNATTAN